MLHGFKMRSSIYSLVPLLFAQNGDAQVAVDQATAFLRKSIQDFDDAAHELLGDQENFCGGGYQQTLDFVTGCRFYCSGNLDWR